MIKYSIVVQHTRDQKRPIPSKKPDDPDFKRFTLTRALNQNKFKENERVKVRRGHKKGNVVKIHRDPDDINWNKHQPMFIQVKFDDGTEVLAHYSQLKRSKL